MRLKQDLPIFSRYRDNQNQVSRPRRRDRDFIPVLCTLTCALCKRNRNGILCSGIGWMWGHCFISQPSQKGIVNSSPSLGQEVKTHFWSLSMDKEISNTLR